MSGWQADQQTVSDMVYGHFHSTKIYYIIVLPFTFRSESVSLLGEMDKLVPLSPQRTVQISVSTGDVEVKLLGVPGETIVYYVYKRSTVDQAERSTRKQKIHRVICSFRQSGQLQLSAKKLTCA